MHRKARHLLVLAALSVMGLAATAGSALATTTGYCGPGDLGGGGFCNMGVPLMGIQDMYGSADHNDYCVYRAVNGSPGAASASGDEYCATSGGYVYQDFHGYGGYAASHNRHSYTMHIYYTNVDY
jgi:hypothetical protein